MLPQLIHETSYATVSLDKAAGCVTLRWRRFAHSTEFRTAMLQVLELVRTSAAPVHDLVFDARDLGPMLQNDIEWGACTIGAQLRSAGVTRMALVHSKTALGRVTCTAFQQATRGMWVSTPETKIFEEREDAERWLAEGIRLA